MWSHRAARRSGTSGLPIPGDDDAFATGALFAVDGGMTTI